MEGLAGQYENFPYYIDKIFDKYESGQDSGCVTYAGTWGFMLRKASNFNVLQLSSLIF